MTITMQMIIIVSLTANALPIILLLIAYDLDSKINYKRKHELPSYADLQPLIFIRDFARTLFAAFLVVAILVDVALLSIYLEKLFVRFTL